MLFNKRISEAIKTSNLTQKEIAKHLNITESNISNWKKGENLPSLETFYTLCLLLNESADYLLGLDEESKQNYIKNSYNNFNGNNNNISFK